MRDEAVLCVFNLSRSAQAVELDLSAQAGLVPVEMLGDSTFPPIGQLPYLLTLPPYGFYWFMLSREGALPAWHTPAPEPMPELRTRVFKASLAEMLDGPLRADLEQNELKSYLMKRRWFSAKNQALTSARFTSMAPLPGTGGRVVMAEVEVGVGKSTERFTLPLATVEEAEAITALPSQLALGRYRRGRRVGFITDAFARRSVRSGGRRGIARRRRDPHQRRRANLTANCASFRPPGWVTRWFRRMRRSGGFRPNSRTPAS